jgi:hypothetical protein
MSMQRTLFLAVLLLAVCLLGNFGCDGSHPVATSGAQRRGAVTFTVKWSARTTRLVPAAANSVVITLTGEGQTATQTINRSTDSLGTSSATFSNLLPLKFTVQATAYPDTDGGGTAQATGAMVIQIEPNSGISLAIQMDSTITDVVVTPTNPSVILGQSTQLIATAHNLQGDFVLVDSSKWKWTSDNPAVASLSPTGERALLNGVTIGSANITVTDLESTKSAQTAASVVQRPAGGNITGHVTDPSNNPLAGIRVETSDGNNILSVNTDANGLYALNGVPAGERVVTFAGGGQTTSYQVTVAQGGTITLDAVLQPFSGSVTGPPIITLNSPNVNRSNGQATITGHIDQLDSANAVLIVNGDEQLIPVDSNGGFSAVAILRAGLNTIYIRATNSQGSALSDRISVTYTPSSTDFLFRVTLQWDGDGDLDLHTWDPSNNHSYYNNKTIATGELDTDNVKAYGPENFTCLQLVSGRYKIGVNSYARAAGRKAVIHVTINRGPNAGRTYNYGPYTFNGSDRNQDYPIYGNTDYWWRPLDIVVGADGSVSVDTADTSVGLPLGSSRASNLKGGKR